MTFIDKQNGFTLIEATLTLLILSIMGSMMYSYFNSAMAHGAIPLIQVQKSLELQDAMEKITADYYDKKGNADFLVQLQTDVTNNVGGKYGTYTITNNDFIKFDGGEEKPAETSDPKNILKITINNDLGEILTSLFTDPNL